MLEDLAGKGVLVTGASTGIGAAAAKAFAAQGAHVVVHYNASEPSARDVRQAIAGAGGTAHLVGGDLRKSGEAKRVVEKAAALLGRLDVLVNNAGSLIARKPLRELGPDLYQAALDLNVWPVIEGSLAALPHLEKSSGAIINIGSIAGQDGGGPGSAHYAAAKAYIHALTRHMARDFAASNIRVNAVAPGAIDTPFHKATPPERLEAMRKSIPFGRLGTPEDCVGPILFLASPSMSGYVTGQILHVNGGQLMP